MNTPSLAAFVVALLAPLSAASIASAQVPQQVPDAIAAPAETLIATAHAEGAQIYDCKADAGGQLVWQFREPIATLLIDGKTVGRHYAGPTWEMLDGSAVVGKQAARAPGATPEDIPWLKLDVASSRGNRQAQRRHDGPETKHQRRGRRRAVRHGRGVAERALLGRLHVPQER